MNNYTVSYRIIGRLEEEAKKLQEKDGDKDINSLFVNCVFTNEQKKASDKNIMWLGNTGAQCHILATNEKPSTSNATLSVTMGNASRLSVIRREDCWKVG